MKSFQSLRAIALSASCTLALTMGASAVSLASNGGFETGDTSDWVYFPSPASTFTVTPDAKSGSFAGDLNNLAETSAAVIKQANLGAGIINPGDSIVISFWAKGLAGAGGVHFAEFFSEIDGGGVSKAEILGGAPLFPSSTDYSFYSFPTTAGPDVSGGVTLQFAAVTGAAQGSFSQLLIDDVTIEAVPEPQTALLSALALLGLLVRRR